MHTLGEGAPEPDQPPHTGQDADTTQQVWLLEDAAVARPQHRPTRKRLGALAADQAYSSKAKPGGVTPTA